jgi:hypothetical protein
MSTSQYLLNLGLLAWILGGNVGTRVVTVRRLRLPLLIVAIAGFVYLRDLPSGGNDVYLELAGALAGAVLGVVAAMLVRVRLENQRVLATAGLGFAALWTAVIGGRIAFAYGATHWFPVAIGRFSMRHQITGADAWTAAFVLMALAMVVVRVAVAAIQRAQVLRSNPVGAAVTLDA